MRMCFLFLLMLMNLNALAQVFDDFSDGDFTNNPSWNGMDTNFNVQNAQLKLNDQPVSDESFLVTPFSNVDSIEWSFYLNMDFRPSSSNQAYIYLLSDTSDLRGNVQGYFVRVGGVDRDVSLFRQDSDRSSGNLTLLIDGQDFSVNTDPSQVRVRVRRDHLGHWQLWSDNQGLDNYINEGTAQDTTYQSNSFVGLLCDYTSTRSDKFFFDEIYAGPYILDTLAPELLAIELFGLDSLVLSFSEELDASPAQNTTNFNLPSGPGISTAKLSTDSIEIELKLSGNLSNGQSYTLYVSNQSDRSGNIAGVDSLTFIARVAEQSAFQDIIINEFMADPNPPVALPQAEYIELFNRSQKFIKLENWQISDASNTVNLNEHWLDPGNYLIICDPNDSADFAGFGDILTVSNLPALNNSGDQIILENENSELIDQIQYNLSWYQDAAKESGGFSIEKINPFSPCDGKFNWTGSESIDGGTPGSQNSVYDTTKPTEAFVIENMEVIDASSARMFFSRSIDSVQSRNARIYRSGFAQDSLKILQFGGDFLDIEFPNGIDTGFDYTIWASRIFDCYGDQFTRSYRYFGIGSPPSGLEIIMTEIYPIPADDGSGRPTSEFIELFNNSDKFLSIASLFISDASSSAEIPGGNIPRKTHAVICPAGEEDQFERDFLTVVGVSSWPSLNNTGDDLSITNASGELIHEVNYDDEWFEVDGDDSKKEGGWSLEMIDQNNPCAGKSNWLPSVSPTGNSFGTANSVYNLNPDESPIEALQAYWYSDSVIFLALNEKVYNIDQLWPAFELSTPDFDLDIDSISEWENGRYSYLLWTEENPLPELDTFILKNDLLTDCAGNPFRQTRVISPVKAKKGDLLINEILFNPFYSDGNDYLEFYNNSGRSLRLDGLYLGDYDAEKNEVEALIPLSESPAAILHSKDDTENYLLLSEDPESVFELYYDDTPEAMNATVLETALPSYNNDEGWVYLLNEDGDTIDFMFYEDGMHHPVLEYDNGISLEKYGTDQESNDSRNWSSATIGPAITNGPKGTPGKANSIRSIPSQVSDLFYVEPELFIPYSNGGFDHIDFHWNLPESSAYAASISIYTDNGREIIRLLNNEPVPTQGASSWNGTSETGEPLAPGIYIAIFEAFEQRGATITEKQIFTIAPSE